jgi:hypothetical protein
MLDLREYCKLASSVVTKWPKWKQKCLSDGGRRDGDSRCVRCSWRGVDLYKPCPECEIASLREQLADSNKAYIQLFENYQSNEEQRSFLATNLVPNLRDRIGMARTAMLDIKRHYGHVSINSGTSTLGLFCDMIIAGLDREPV